MSRRQLAQPSTWTSSSARCSIDKRRSRKPATMDSEGQDALLRTLPAIECSLRQQIAARDRLGTFGVEIMTAEINQEALCALHSLGRTVWPEVDLDIAAFSTLAGRVSAVRLDTLRAGDL